MNSTPISPSPAPSGLLKCLLLIAVSLTTLTTLLDAQINYQGQLTDINGAPENGLRSLTFNIYSVNPSATLVWGPKTIQTEVVNGFFNVIIPANDDNTPTTRVLSSQLRPLDVPALDTGERTLGITIGGTEITPRQQILASPKALHAQEADHAKTADVVDSDVLFTQEMALRVGVGTSTPDAKLDVVGTGPGATLRLNRTIGSNDPVLQQHELQLQIHGIGEQSLGIGVMDNGVGVIFAKEAGNSLVNAAAGGYQKLVLNPTGGNVGIGTATPGKTLDVNGDIRGSFIVRQFGTYEPGSILSNTTFGMAFRSGEANPTGGDFLFADSAGGHLMVINSTGSVGIGTSTPTQAKLVVTGAGTSNATNAGWNYNSVGGLAYSTSSFQASIHATHPIHASTFLAYSDARIKNVDGRSDGAVDLATLNGLEITDYRYKDVISRGSLPQKKVIAQQLETIFPQAVSRQTNVIPDIYEKATILEDGWIELATDLKKGERGLSASRVEDHRRHP